MKGGDKMSLKEYRTKADQLETMEVTDNCCGKLMDIIQVEPLEGKNIFRVTRTCIVRCPVCNKEYIGQYD